MHQATLAGLALALSCASAVTLAAPQTPAAGASADNTRVNQRDRQDAASTPQHQSNDSSDRKLLAAARRSVVKDKSLSTSAHNIKMMVASGAVTLRGPVNTADEKARIENLVKQVPGVQAVDNQLDVKAH
jgi:hyperosmotically inducible protein